MHVIGKIDRNFYKCITNDIQTEDVIITEERIEHIKDRHPNDYEQYCDCLKTVVESPDYIIKSNKRDTALILKEIEGPKGGQFKTILRLITSSDKREYKNSILTFMRINRKEWSRLIRNKKILYKRE